MRAIDGGEDADPLDFGNGKILPTEIDGLLRYAVHFNRLASFSVGSHIIQLYIFDNAGPSHVFLLKWYYTLYYGILIPMEVFNMITLIQGDITKVQDVDAIVNAANKSLLGGGGVDGAIHRAAGPELLEECKKFNGCETGEARITGAYNLPCKYVIHTPGPVWHGGGEGEAELLASCYRNSLEVAVGHGVRKIAFPSISTGIFSYPLDQAAKIAVDTVKAFMAENPDAIDLVEWVLFDDATYAAYDKEING